MLPAVAFARNPEKASPRPRSQGGDVWLQRPFRAGTEGAVLPLPSRKLSAPVPRGGVPTAPQVSRNAVHQGSRDADSLRESSVVV